MWENKAKMIAEKAHEGQLDKGGAPYILHPIAVSEKVEGDETKAVALLHDVIEDTAITLKALEEEGFPESVREAVRLLTKKPEDSYEQYLLKIKKNPLAKQVKLADLQHNMDLGRISKPTEKDLKRVSKYKKALVILGL